MVKPKVNWKARCIASEGKLKIAEDACEALRQMNTYVEVPVEKIVDREVLPKWVAFWLIVFMVFMFYLVICAFREVSQLQTPIEKPYPVLVMNKARGLEKELAVYKDAWREDELEIKKLKRHQRQEN